MLRHLLYPLLPYRSMFLPFFIACAIAVPCWLLFRLYRRRTPAHRMSLAREVLLLIFVVYLAGLASATLTPNRSARYTAEATVGLDLHPSLTSLSCATAQVPSGSRGRGFCVRNAGGNVVLFFPLGILIPLVWPRLRFWRGVMIAMALSFSIELVQYMSRTWGVNRTADINDFILNVVGASVGLVIVLLLRASQGTRTVVAR